MANKTTDTYTCQQCGALYLGRADRKDTTKYCSRECYQKSCKGKQRVPRQHRECVGCGQLFTVPLKCPDQKACSKKCSNIGMRKPVEALVERRKLTIRNHPLAYTNGTISEHRFVLYAVLGPGEHPCHWCNKTLHWSNEGLTADVIVADHLDGNPKNNSPSNLVASCLTCNIQRPRRVATDEVYLVSKVTEDGIEHRRRGVPATCAYCGKAFVKRADNDNKCCSKSCGAKLRWQTKPPYRGPRRQNAQ